MTAYGGKWVHVEEKKIRNEYNQKIKNGVGGKERENERKDFH